MTLGRGFISAVLAVCVVAAPGCASDPAKGYTFGGEYSKEIRTVAAPIWENRTREPELAAMLTEAIIKEIERSTPWRVVESGASATLTGVVTDADLRRLGRDSTTGLMQELAFDIAVDFTWTNNRNRRVLVERSGFRAQGQFVPARGANEPIDVGRLGAIDALARAVVAELRSDW